MSENRLGNESSPYLLQHAKNPVHWYAWDEEALARAKKENKPIFLSVGYSSCHWCHVMAHESFEDDEIAKIMNENFVNIKNAIELIDNTLELVEKSNVVLSGKHLKEIRKAIAKKPYQKL